MHFWQEFELVRLSCLGSEITREKSQKNNSQIHPGYRPIRTVFGRRVREWVSDSLLWKLLFLLIHLFCLFFTFALFRFVYFFCWPCLVCYFFGLVCFVSCLFFWFIIGFPFHTSTQTRSIQATAAEPNGGFLRKYIA